MKTIGFIDYYIDQWHAHNYPRMIRQSAAWSGEFQISLAWAQCDLPGKMPLAEWCARNNIHQAESLQQVVESCDCLVILSPDHPRQHEELAQLALRSGKPTYIDKPIAATRAAAQQLFDLARVHGTPMMSCSALRFAPALADVLSNHRADRWTTALTRGGGTFDIYAIHQVEMLVMLLGCGAKSVTRHCRGATELLLVDYDDDRFGMIALMPGHPFEFSVRTAGDGKTICSGSLTDFFPKFIDSMLGFFAERRSTVPESETLEIAAIIEQGRLADEGVPCPLFLSSKGSDPPLSQIANA